jgi:hypothetical protein
MVKKPTKAARTAERGMGETQPGDANVAKDQVARERAEMLVEKQAELDGVLDKHDDMVRVPPLLCVWLGQSAQTSVVGDGERRSARCSISNSLSRCSSTIPR